MYYKERKIDGVLTQLSDGKQFAIWLLFILISLFYGARKDIYNPNQLGST